MSPALLSAAAAAWLALAEVDAAATTAEVDFAASVGDGASEMGIDADAAVVCATDPVLALTLEASGTALDTGCTSRAVEDASA